MSQKIGSRYDMSNKVVRNGTNYQVNSDSVRDIRLCSKPKTV